MAFTRMIGTVLWFVNIIGPLSDWGGLCNGPPFYQLSSQSWGTFRGIPFQIWFRYFFLKYPVLYLYIIIFIKYFLLFTSELLFLLENIFRKSTIWWDWPTFSKGTKRSVKLKEKQKQDNPNQNTWIRTILKQFL